MKPLQPGELITQRIESLEAEIERLRAALQAAKEFVEGLNEPIKFPTTFQISSYQPCGAILDKIRAALALEQKP